MRFSMQSVNFIMRDSQTVAPKTCIEQLMKILNKNIQLLPDSCSSSDLANSFGNFFTQKIQKIRNEVDDSETSCNCNDVYIPSCETAVINFDAVSEDELLAIVKKCPSKSCVLDPLPTWLVKQHITVLLPTLTRIVNESLSSGTFPDEFKKAMITPVLKKPSLNKEELKNYRPVANMQLASKLVEKCAAKQVINHVQSNNLQEPMQSAYRACHATETALAKVHSDFQCAIDNQKAVLLLLLDLSAAFDTVDHDILIKRLA